jgi:hypothetical protein
MTKEQKYNQAGESLVDWVETRIKGWEVAPPPSEDERELGWSSWAKETLSNGKLSTTKPMEK